ncbi:UDP-3-O-[3-hydroxymyristoyl] glucosamine N-acyltransferase [Oceaniovalibus guishaninsula JLT2003]|uniref:UDP-3-O-acylglucosamine N-acyltransferase n=1 Tax=Oceaniovalibus guishaninsula JLT2003 TaxID=1231392 RepID=K2I3P0_9RHOB|nr:UDP-3-O-(3-hydroxymyristoyl)glucosamine N-acyltransferase [Oceaniovalibus guishaninsula]EKE43495.1 UDP-3-O-[3-hydroxymyristoyl] glucosamine N-acyltransferase [Oceaniovalibus guishaninsula JLT2003]
MKIRVSELAKALGARLEGDGTIVVSGATEPADAGPDDLALAMAPAYADGVPKGRARAAILWPGADWTALGLQAAIFVPRARLAMAQVTAMLDPGPHLPAGIHPTALVDSSARIGPGAAIGPYTCIGPNVRIGARCRIVAHVTIGADTVIGDDALMSAGTRIGDRVVIGDRFVAQPGAVVGADGLSFVTPEKSGVEEVRESLGARGEIRPQGWSRIHSLGTVIVGNDVELGANSCIDRGTIRATRVGDGCKIDNLVHIAHNVVMGRDCLLAALTGIAGSTVVGDRCVFGGASGIADNVQIGDDVIITGGTKVLSNVPAGRVMMGYPAVRMDQNVDMYKALRRLPRLLRDLGSRQKAVPNAGPND